VRWLRAEYATKTEAHKELGVRSIIEDDEVYDFLKLLARFVQLAGYAGLLVTFDEMGVLSHRLNHAGARDANYEVILTIVNDCLTGSASRIGFYFAGVEEFLQDTRRGLYSHQALRRRLEDSQVLDLKVVDFSGPVIRLPSLTREELFVLLGKIRDIFAGGDPSKRLVTDDAIQLYMDHCRKSLGAEYYQTPSDVVRPFARFLSILERNPGIDWRGRLSSIRVERFRDGNEGQSSDKIVEDHGGPVQDASHSHLDDGLETYGT
jgi:hypothetical protein